MTHQDEPLAMTDVMPGASPDEIKPPASRSAVLDAGAGATVGSAALAAKMLQSMRGPAGPKGLDQLLPAMTTVLSHSKEHARQLVPLLRHPEHGPSVGTLIDALHRALARPDVPDALCGILIDRLMVLDPQAAGIEARAVLSQADIRPHSLVAAAWALRTADGANDPGVDRAMCRAIQQGIPDAVLLRAWFDDRIEEAGMSAALSRLAILAAESSPSPLLARMLQRWSRHRVAAVIDDLSPETTADCHAVWEDYIHHRQGDLERCERVAALPVAVLRAAMVSLPTRTVSLHSNHPHHLHLLHTRGINVTRLRTALSAFFSVTSKSWRSVLEGPGQGAKEANSRIMQGEALTGWQDRAVEDGSLTCACPIDGGIRHAFDSMVAHGTAFYAFGGKEVFYLICAGYSMRSAALWCPGRRLMITFRGLEEELGEWLVLNSGHGTLLGRVAAHRQAWLAARDAPPARRRITILLRSTPNFAHQLWNFYSGFERLAVAGLLPRLHRVVHFGDNFFGPFADIYPDLPPGLVTHQQAVPVFDAGAFSTQDLVIPVGGYFIPRTLRLRIRKAMARRPPASPDTPDPASAEGPIVWLGIRVTDKGWVNQEGGLAELCRLILARHPSATFVVDGFTLPVGVTEVPSAWQPALDRMQQVVAGIARELGRPDRIVSLVGQTMREAVLWAAASDAYVAPLGTSQHKVAWFSDAPGVIYAHPSYIPHPDLSPGFWEAEWLPRPVLVAGVPDAGAGDNVTVRLPRPKMENLHMDAGRVAEEVLAILGRMVPVLRT